MYLAHKIALNPNQEQIDYFCKACGVARFAYNWALAEWKRQYEAGEKPSWITLNRQLNAVKSSEYPWMLEVSKYAPQQAIMDLGDAFKHFFRRVKQGGNPGYPKFKKKGIRDSFRADNGLKKAGMDAVTIEDNRIKLPRIGWIKMHESLRFDGQIKSVTVSRIADKWFAAVLVETDTLPHKRRGDGCIGIDLGVKTLATLSNGEVIQGPKPHKAKMDRLRRLNKSLARKQKGSSNFKKAKTKLAKLHYQIGCIRLDAMHKATTKIVLENDVIGIEDLNVSGMSKNRKLARSILDMGFGEFRRQLEYKAQWYGSRVVVADRWFPSSKTCHQCGTINTELMLKDRSWQCDCGATHDRDLNAAINLKFMAESSPATACGLESAEPSLAVETMPERSRKKDLVTQLSMEF